MTDLFELLGEVWRVIVTLWKIGNRWLRFAILGAVLWPMMVIVVATITPASIGRTMVISAIAILPLVALIGIALGTPLLWAAVLSIPRGRRILTWFLGFIGLELTAGIFFAFVPVSKEPNLVVPFLLVVIAFFLLKAAGWARRVRKLLGLLAISIAIVWLLGGWSATKSAIGGAPSQPGVAAGVNSNSSCDDGQLLDYNALGSQPLVRVVGQRKDCFKDVVKLPDAYARIGGVCAQPYPLPTNDHPNPNWAVRFQFVVHKEGVWIPWGKPTPWYHWTNRPADQPYFSNHPFTLQMEIDAPAEGGITFYPAPPGTACGPS